MKKIIKKILKGTFKLFRGIYRLIPLPARSKKRIKHFIIWTLDKSYASLAPGTMRRNNVYVASHADKDRLLDIYEEYIDGIFQTGKKGEEFVEYKQHSISFSDEDVKPIVFYLPQFYTFSENDKWWGKGFTEWTNVTKAVPQFPGHYQPHLPYDSAFYDQSKIETIKHQIKLAQNYGIYGFCFHYYWFNGKRLLEKPLDILLNSEIDFPFCINWANENWTRRWDGHEDDILMAQHYSPDDDLANITEICKYVRDKRYIRVNGKPLILIYRANILPDANRTIQIWRDYCRKNGIGEVHLAAVITHEFNPMIYNFDEAVVFPHHDVKTNPINTIEPISLDYNGWVHDMEEYISNKRYYYDYNPYYGLFPSWDNTARRGNHFHLYKMNPALYKKWLSDILRHTKENRDPGDRIIFINAWNEWAEGAHLEPCRKYGHANLQATADAVLDMKS